MMEQKTINLFAVQIKKKFTDIQAKKKKKKEKELLLMNYFIIYIDLSKAKNIYQVKEKANQS